MGMPTATRPISAQESSQVRKGPQGTVIRGHRAPGEADSCPEELAALVEHELFDDLVRPSARPSTDGGIVRPSALAVFKLMTNSNRVGCSTGRSAGFAPLRILSTKVAARRTKSRRFAP